MKAIQLLVNSYLPEDLRDYTREYDGGSIGKLMAEVAKKYPDKYEQISKVISDIGRQASYHQGETLTLQDMRPVLDKNSVLSKMDLEIQQIENSKLDAKAKQREKIQVWQKYSEALQDETMLAAKAKGTNLAHSIISKAKGKPPQLKMMVTTPGLYADYKGQTIPLFIRKSFGEGLRPAEYMAGSFGARQSVIATKSSTAKGGDFSKILAQSAAPLIVTGKKSNTTNGLSLELDNPGLRGRVLARGLPGMPAGTVLDKEAISQLRKAKVKRVIVHSPITDESEEGISAEAVGADSRGMLPSVGSAVGITAAQAIGEPVTQMSLNTKHLGGLASAKKEFSGFEVINQFVQTPEEFPDRAAVSELDGTVESITEAAQGGTFVKVDGVEHYVNPGYDILVKVGDKLESGDQISDGLVDPGDVVRLRGLGEGRKYYAERLGKILEASGMPPDPVNVELLARANINHVVIDDPEGLGDYLPDDIVKYDRLQANYVPPKNTVRLEPSKARGQYLQKPTLHYSIGTRITPRVANEIKDSGVDSIFVSPDKPGFTPLMVRLRTASHHQDDWLAKMHTSYMKKNIADDAMRGRTTNIGENIHFAPRLAVGKGFGESVGQSGKF